MTWRLRNFVWLLPALEIVALFFAPLFGLSLATGVLVTFIAIPIILVASIRLLVAEIRNHFSYFWLEFEDMAYAFGMTFVIRLSICIPR